MRYKEMTDNKNVLLIERVKDLLRAKYPADKEYAEKRLVIALEELEKETK